MTKIYLIYGAFIKWASIYCQELCWASFLDGASGKEHACQCRRHKRLWFDPWVRKIPWKRAWQPTLIFLPGASLGQRSLVGYVPKGCKESDTAEAWIFTTLNIHWKDWCWSWSSNTLATWCQEPTRGKRPWCWERLRAGEEGDDRDDCMASPTQWTWDWANSGRWWGTRKPGVLQSTGSQSVGHNWVTEQQMCWALRIER